MAVLDDFNRADGAPGANWAQAVSAYSIPNIVSNELSWPQYPSGYWITSFAANQYVSVKKIGIGGCSLLLRVTNPNTGTVNFLRMN